jgi:hypothetical protein
MPVSSLHLASLPALGLRPVTFRPRRRHLVALGALLTLATAVLVAWPPSPPNAVPMEPLLAAPVTGLERDWMLDFLRQTDTLHRLGRDGRIWVPQAQASTLRRQAQALGLAPTSTEAPKHSATTRRAAPALGRNGVN